MARSPTGRRAPQPLDEAGLERLALFYVGRYATGTAKLAAYLGRKIAERGWQGARDPRETAQAVAGRMAEAGYVDDAAFAEARGRALTRAGYGVRRVGQALRRDGLGEAAAQGALDEARDAAWTAALALARRRRIGPFAAVQAEGPAAQKAISVMLRGGHDLATARRIVAAGPGEEPDAPDFDG